MKRITALSLFIALLSFSCNAQSGREKNVEIFDIVWETINDEYFDPTFNGLDWRVEYDRYKPIIENCETDDSLYHYLNQMLFKLNVSHLFALQPGYEDEMGSPQLFLDGETGIDLRLIENEAIVISVKENSPAEKAGIKTGYNLIKVNGRTIDSFLEEKKAEPLPPFNDVHVRMLATENIIRELYGEPGDSVDVTFLNENNIAYNVTLHYENRTAEKISFIPSLPPMYASFDKKIINENIAYIHFDVFLPVLLDTIVTSILEYNDFPNLIIDIRGNPWGDFNTRRTIAAQFVSKRISFWKYQRRNEINEVFLDPPSKPYMGKIVILIDELSSSSSEEFAGAMKAIGRATIVGQKTAGKVLTMEIVELPDGGIFVYPNQQTRTSKDEILEAVGVQPDIIVEWNKKDLLKGVDKQLEKAIVILQN